MNRACGVLLGALCVLAAGATSTTGALRVHSLELPAAQAAIASGRLPSTAGRAAASTAWCGTATRDDLKPNAIAGHPVHWVYAFPSDGEERLLELGSAMQADAEAIDAWWRSQDPTRTPRNDLAQLPCGLQLDLTTLRMARSSAELASDRVFGDVFQELARSGFHSRFTKYVVYFDGPVANERICGQGGSDASGFGLAVVYVRACTGVSAAAVAAHELLHTFGAVPAGAPSRCPEPHGAHTCDDPNDIMHPFIDRSPLSSKTLDSGRNDYYGHSAAFPDSRNSPWLVRLDSQAQLRLSISGPGSVEADVPGLTCATSCTTTWNAGTELRLAATPASGAKLVRWGGPCGASSECALAVGPEASASVLFAPRTYRLRVSVSGRGLVRSRGPGVACRGRCSAALASHTPVVLTAAPATGWAFRGWRGACRGTKRACTLPMTAAASVGAVFVRPRR